MTSFRYKNEDEDEDEKEEQEEKREKEQDKGPGPLGEKLLLKGRTILLFGEINQKVAQEVTAKLLLLAQESDDDIKLYINSPGGHVESGDTIHDMIRFVKPRVKVIGTGWVASAGALIFVATPRDLRYCLPNTRFMLHQPSGGVGGQATDISIEAQEILKMRQRLNELFARETGQPLSRIEKDTDRNFWMSAVEARDYGLVNHIVMNSVELD
ncbi:ATP-dependent Clp protease proteolytic subunit [Verrucomicrobia bacterium LW23]|nr:ATP-dependent Clp protease proteolytic subunit [Verrucomicrobia bacterium LW23]